MTGSTTVPTGKEAFLGTMPQKGALLGFNLSEMSSPILVIVLMKMRFRSLPPSMSTRVRMEPATTGSRTSGNFPGSEKLVHWSSLEKVIDVSLCLNGF